MDAETWHIPLDADTITIDEALQTMDSFKLNQDDVPFIIRLFENPKYNILPGSVTLKAHDIIHILLSRGVLPKDEAFVIGFTMGTTGKLSTITKTIFKLVTGYLYPDGYRFDKDEYRIYEYGIECASIMTCPDLSSVDLTELLGYTIKNARERLGINTSTLREYYILEQAWSLCPESQRLL